MTGKEDSQPKVIQASFVFLCAGPLGSTQVLMQSRFQGFEVSDQLGKKFNGNGGLLGKKLKLFKIN